jgi:hypothetical protein
MRRVLPAFALFLLSPFVAEFLLGDFGLDQLTVFIGLAPMYGAGAILIREVSRRAGRGWPTMILLAVAYGVLEEGFVTMSLFNPDYAHAHLLDHGFIPALGIAVPWTIFVVSIHAIWSISLPILTIEGFTSRRTTPWLRTPGLVVAAIVFVLGAALDAAFSWFGFHYLASWPQLLGAGVVVILLVVAAFRPWMRNQTDGFAPAPWVVLVTVLVLGLLFMAGFGSALPVWAGVVLQLIALGGAVAAIGAWSARSGWGDRHRFAIACGGLLTYAWHSFLATPILGGGPVITPVSHAVFALVTAVLLGFQARAIRSRPAETPERVAVS